MKAIDWSKIDITDNYMFVTVFSRPDLCRELLERILSIRIRRVEMVNAERTVTPEYGAHGIRMDVYVEDEAGTVYDIEMQRRDYLDLPMRARYYLSSNDMDCIEAGQDYKDMRDSIVIFICMFDPLHLDLPRYTITPHCKENGVEVPDGTTRVFINPSAWKNCDDERLVPFLKYLMGDKIDDEFCKDVDAAVRAERDRPE